MIRRSSTPQSIQEPENMDGKVVMKPLHRVSSYRLDKSSSKDFIDSVAISGPASDVLKSQSWFLERAINEGSLECSSNFLFSGSKRSLDLDSVDDLDAFPTIEWPQNDHDSSASLDTKVPSDDIFAPRSKRHCHRGLLRSHEISGNLCALGGLS
eukprot:Nitzschia sp. Nitz4//scaffold12_size214221//154195//154656//NITZ4_001520-RA/size214221-processed-gene-0.172-mRNA-1//-1//CDS//3329535080//8183//frame0